MGSREARASRAASIAARQSNRFTIASRAVSDKRSASIIILVTSRARSSSVIAEVHFKPDLPIYRGCSAGDEFTKRRTAIKIASRNCTLCSRLSHTKDKSMCRAIRRVLSLNVLLFEPATAMRFLSHFSYVGLVMLEVRGLPVGARSEIAECAVASQS